MTTPCGTPFNWPDNDLWLQPEAINTCGNPPTSYVRAPSNWDTPLYPGQPGGPTMARILDNAPTVLNNSLGFLPLESLEIGGSAELVLENGHITMIANLFRNDGNVHGYGRLAFDRLTSGHINSGTIEADSSVNSLSIGVTGPGDEGPVAFVNDGTLGASGNGILGLSRVHFFNANGQISADDDSRVVMGDFNVPIWVRVIGGALSTSGNGEIHIPTFYGAEMEGTIDQTGLVTVAGQLRASADLTFTGSGHVTLVGGAITSVAGAQVTNAAGHTIDGGNGFGGGIVPAIFVNNGVVDANHPSLDLDVASMVTNNGLMQASSGGTLTLGAGQIQNQSTIQALPGSVVRFAGGTTLQGGTLASSGDGKMTVISPTNMLGSITNNAAVENLSTINATGDLQLGGSGHVTILASAGITSNAGVTVTNAVGHTISGGHGFSGGIRPDRFVNFGVVDATDPSRSLSVTGMVTNNGLMQASGGGILSLGAGHFDNQGTIQALPGSFVRFVGGATLQGGTLDTTGDGQITITNGTVNMAGAVVNHGTVAVVSTLKASEDLLLDGSGRVTLGVSAQMDSDPGVTITNGEFHTINGLSGFAGAISAEKTVNLGTVQGMSMTERIKLLGRMEGPGILDHVRCLTGCTYAPGSGGPVADTVAVSVGSVEYLGVLEIDIGGNVPGSGYDQINHALGDGLAELGGRLNVDLLNEFVPAAGDVFTIMTATTLDGTFSGLPNGARLDTVDGFGSFQVTYDAIAGNVQLSAFLAAVDFTADGMVNIDDLNALLSEGPVAPGVGVTPATHHFDLNGDGIIDNNDVDQWLADGARFNGLSSPYLRGDANLNGVVDGTDFNIWNSQKFQNTLLWGEGNFNGDGVTDGTDFNLWNQNKFTSSLSAVPEPTGSAGLLVLVLSFFRGRRTW